MTDEEFQALRERYRRAGDAWSSQLDTVRRAEVQADRLLAEFQDMEQRLTAEQYRRCSEALAAQERAGAALEEARDALYWANMALADAIIDTVNATCDHPDTAGPTCAHCGEFYISEDSLQFSDDFRILTSDVEDLQREGFPCLAPWGSEYYYFPHSRSHSA